MDLTTTNILLGIMAAVSLLQGLVLLGLAYAGYRLYRTATATLQDLETRYVQPMAARVTDVLDDVKAVSARVSAQADRVDHAITSTIDRVDSTAERVRAGVSARVSRVASVWHGMRAAVTDFVNGHGNGNGTDGRSAGVDVDRSVSTTGL